MARSITVDVYCRVSWCEYRGRVSADRYVARRAARRCPLCGASPVRIAIPGWSANASRPVTTLAAARP